MSSVNAIIGAVNRAIDRLGRKSALKRDAVKELEESMLREAAGDGGPGVRGVYPNVDRRHLEQAAPHDGRREEAPAKATA